MKRVGVAVMTWVLVACSDSDDCARGNPLMPTCVGLSTRPLGPETQLVFVSNLIGNDAEIYSMNSDGTDLRRLTNSPGGDGGARWSPDGSQIAFNSTRVPPREIWVMNADGSNQRRLTSLGTVSQFPDWSPDGRQIVFQVRQADGNWDIHVMDADGSNPRLIKTGNSQVTPRWSPDGRRIAMTWYESTAECPLVMVSPVSPCNGRIALMNADGTGLTLLPSVGSDDSWPDWSPDGRQLLFASYRSEAPELPARSQIMVMNADGSGARALTSGMLDEWNPVWSGVSNRFYFVRYFQVYSANIDGTDAGRVTAHGLSDVVVDAR